MNIENFKAIPQEITLVDFKAELDIDKTNLPIPEHILGYSVENIQNGHSLEIKYIYKLSQQSREISKLETKCRFNINFINDEIIVYMMSRSIDFSFGIFSVESKKVLGKSLPLDFPTDDELKTFLNQAKGRLN